ncbi:MAG: ATP-binding cassette domain-containing protein [Polyangiaceae bacterium]|nr:ATP-binding cassette domain-containing protein [Myxococcales bacterium]MCB9585957.1 ATP-binding cassette domain-containing protein [Polyangiaceae bacterium]MCB9607113.1 ATP-binding cassette domain-containing protein [Polyangiaceae bacterium]
MAAQDPIPALRLAEVAIDFGRGPVLTGVNLGVAPGELVVLLGASGSGKSSLLRLFNRLAEPSAGQVEFAGKPLAEYEPRALRRRVALITQAPVMFPGSVRDNLGMVPRGYDPPTEHAMAQELAALGLHEDLLEQDASRLSGGEKQRVSLARSLLMTPEVLLLDEPTSALDPHHEAKVAQLIADLRARSRLTCVVVTHSERLATQLGGRWVLIRGGRLLEQPDDGALMEFFSGSET